MASESNLYKYVVIGGGVAGVTCAETLSYLCPEERILLITASPVVKTVTNFIKVSRALEEFDVEETPGHELEKKCKNVDVLHAVVSQLDCDRKVVTCQNGQVFVYNRLCLCTGGVPKLIAPNNPHVLGIRDTETVKAFQQRLSIARRIVVVGNGGIATEIVYEVQGCEVVWAIKDKSISSTFVDAGAAVFFLPQLKKEKGAASPVSKRMMYTSEEVQASLSCSGSALGPDWSSGLEMTGLHSSSYKVHVHYKVEVEAVLTPNEFHSSDISACNPFVSDTETHVEWPIYVKLNDGTIYGCDFIVSATGVIPNTGPFLNNNSFALSSDGGITVSSEMLTSVSDVYAAGDVCSVGWAPAPHWQQMRLWQQARQMGHYAAKCMANHSGQPTSMDFCFELFAHITRFFNYKVVLLGRFNGQNIPEHSLILRTTPGLEYVKVVLKDGVMQGCVLIGDTDLEETFENLILNGMDLSVYGADLLDPGIDIEDYFD